MEVAFLKDVLNDEEKTKAGGLLNRSIQQLTVYELSNLAFMLIKNSRNGALPKDGGCLSAIAITILTDRAIEKNIPIF